MASVERLLCQGGMLAKLANIHASSRLSSTARHEILKSYRIGQLLVPKRIFATICHRHASVSGCRNQRAHHSVCFADGAGSRGAYQVWLEVDVHGVHHGGGGRK